MFTVSQLGDLPLFVFVFLLLARVGSSDLAEVLSTLPQLAFEYLVWTPGGFTCAVHLLTLLGLALQVAVFLKAAQ